MFSNIWKANKPVLVMQKHLSLWRLGCHCVDSFIKMAVVLYYRGHSPLFDVTNNTI